MTRTVPRFTDRAPSRLRDRRDVSDTRFLILRDAWWGLGPSLVASYELRRDPTGALVGDVTGIEDDGPAVTRALDLPAAATAKLLALLAAAPLSKKPYEPTVTHTDDFPSLRLMLYVGPASDWSGFAMLETPRASTTHHGGSPSATRPTRAPAPTSAVR